MSHKISICSFFMRKTEVGWKITKYLFCIFVGIIIPCPKDTILIFIIEWAKSQLVPLQISKYTYLHDSLKWIKSTLIITDLYEEHCKPSDLHTCHLPKRLFLAKWMQPEITAWNIFPLIWRQSIVSGRSR